MKRVIYAAGLLVTILTLSFKIHATPPASNTDKHEFKATDREINFDIERTQGQVALYFQSEVFNTLDEILVERSGTDNGSYSVCKTIEVSQINDNYYKSIDKYPMPAQRDCYYRIKTVAKDGSMKTFPPVLLSALVR